MRFLQYSDVAAFADGVDDLSSVIETLLNSDIDSANYDYLVSLVDKLTEAVLRIRNNYSRNSLLIYKKGQK